MTPTKGTTAPMTFGPRAVGRRLAFGLVGGSAAVALLLGVAAVTPAAAQNAPLELPQQGQSLAKPGKAKPARAARTAKPQSSGRVQRPAVQQFRQPSYEDLAPQGTEEGGPGIRPSFRGGKPALNLGF
ncbi:hypothetical protein [Chelatococcus asaccharovorans]|uniref:Uncharacterized protein n=2 Tax=Chelatococcus asaccharovorans TaxID=28210 RepID=A0A2V3UC14_9HYPH|nr:hypothetical protein [Chelatococcus asaccharovorans]MBS7703421.1 hypothetical protein [Chelatococcus asaccharovorans]PXW61761.1 hypothetical protein C7450_103279 [Chelatococcus asaccharovorans]